MKITKKIARKIIFPSLMMLKVDKLIQALSKNTYLNIMYHGVVPNDTTYFSPRNITEKQFEKQLKYFKKNFDIISVNEAFRRIQNNVKPQRKTITISFDDGFKNNLTTALPLLEKYDIPTTFFISSIIVEENEVCCLWSELIATLNYFHRNEIVNIGPYRFNNLFDAKNNISLTDMLKSCSAEERDKLLSELVNKYDLNTKIKEIPEEIWKLMNIDELKQLSQSNIVDIGSHGHLHYNLGEVSIRKAKEELNTSKVLLEKTVNQEISLIAYPDGSYNDSVKDAAEKIGYTGQFAVNYKTPSDIQDKRIMNRHGLASTTTYESNIIFLNKAFNTKGIKI